MPTGMDTSQHDQQHASLAPVVPLLGVQLVHHPPHRQVCQHVRQPARHLQLDKLIPHIVSEFLWHKVEFWS